MPQNHILTPAEASNIALNAYFALKDWINDKPTKGVESRANVLNRVLGPGNAGTVTQNSSVGKMLPGATLGQIFQGNTGWNTTSGFGYVLNFENAKRRHAIVAVRGTRPEIGLADIGTDFRCAHTGFGDYGRVHLGFKNAFDSILAQLRLQESAVLDAEVVHCVGHSLGGAIATLVAGHYRSLGKEVKLYTFGSPRVGYRGAHETFEQRIGQQNIFRVAHDSDPITMIGTWPYVHVNPSWRDAQNFTLDSPVGHISMKNHDMNNYVKSLATEEDWSGVRAMADRCDHTTSRMARMLLADGGGSWIIAFSAPSLALLLTCFRVVLKGAAFFLYDVITGIDLLACVLLEGIKFAGQVAGQIMQLLRFAAKWAKITVANDAAFTETVIRAILSAMQSKVVAAGNEALALAGAGLRPTPLLLAGALLISASAL